MGQKQSCFGDFEFSRFKRKKKSKKTKNPSAKHVFDFRDGKTYGMSGCRKSVGEGTASRHFSDWNFRNLLKSEEASGMRQEAAKTSKESEIPDFHIEDGTLILKRSMEERWTNPLSSKFLPSVTSHGFETSKNPNESEVVADETRRYSPNKLSKGELSLIDSNAEENMCCSNAGYLDKDEVPLIPPRMNKMAPRSSNADYRSSTLAHSQKSPNHSEKDVENS